MEAISYHLVRAVQTSDLDSVADAMVRGANPNGRYAGTYPLHMAVETGNVEMAAFLVHWGAKPVDMVDSGGRSAVLIAKGMAKKAGKKDNEDPMVKMLTDEEHRKKLVEAMQARMEEKHQRVRAERRKSLPKQFAFFFFLFMASIIGLHAFIIYAPEAAERYLPPKMLSDIQLLSPVLEHPAHTEYNRLLAAQKAQEAQQAFDSVAHDVQQQLKEEL